MINATTESGTRKPLSADDPLESLVARAERILFDGPHPTDYLTVPSAEAKLIDEELELVQGMHPSVPMDESLRRKVLQDRTLQHHFARRAVATLRTDRGVIVLAAGESEIAVVFQAIPASRRQSVVTEFPRSL